MTFQTKSAATNGELGIVEDQVKNQDFSEFFDLNEKCINDSIEDTSKLDYNWFLKQHSFFSDQIHKKDLEEEHSNNHFLETELFDTSFDTHRPNVNYAIPVEEDFEVNFNYSKVFMNL